MNLNRSLLLPIDLFTEFTSLDVNIDGKLLRNAILDAQELRLKPLIGTSMIVKLYNDFSTNALTENYRLLLFDYVYPYLLKAAEYEIIDSLNTKYTAMGVMNNRTDNSDSASRNDVTYLKSTLDKKINQLGDELFKYLSMHTDIYPEFITINTDKINATIATGGDIYIDPYIKSVVNSADNIASSYISQELYKNMMQ